MRTTDAHGRVRLIVHLILLTLCISVCESAFVVEVDLTLHNLTHVPDDVQTNVTKLVLEQNFITQVETFPPYTGLTELRLGDNQLTAFPRLSNISSTLTKLMLAHNQIAFIEPQRLDELNLLSGLDLTYNRLSVTVLPPFPLHVTTFNLVGNEISRCPEAGVIPVATVHLALEFNQIEDCSTDTYPVGSLVDKVGLGGNSLTRLPNFWPIRSTLRMLSLWGNDISVVTRPDFDYLTALVTVYLNGNPLTTVPDITALPPTFGHLDIAYLPLLPCDYPKLKWINSVRLAGVMTVNTIGSFRSCFESDQDAAKFDAGEPVDFVILDEKTSSMENERVRIMSPRSISSYQYHLRAEPVHALLGVSLTQCARECLRAPACTMFYTTNGGQTCVVTNGGQLVPTGNETISELFVVS